MALEVESASAWFLIWLPASVIVTFLALVLVVELVLLVLGRMLLTVVAAMTPLALG